MRKNGERGGRCVADGQITKRDKRDSCGGGEEGSLVGYCICFKFRP